MSEQETYRPSPNGRFRAELDAALGRLESKLESAVSVAENTTSQERQRDWYESAWREEKARRQRYQSRARSLALALGLIVELVTDEDDAIEAAAIAALMNNEGVS